ncbi:MAG: GNAT family N-acetyltransferase [Chloroflexota bacterium]
MITQTKKIIRDLGNGLVLRHGSSEDAEALALFNGRIHGDDEEDGLRIVAWTRDLLTRPHPTLKPEDFTVVEETSSGRIVSSLNLILQTWSYEGIEFGVGRPELVGTLPEFRDRGLVRLQFEEMHKWSAERGHMVQAITGIPFYYRQFGYEMAIDLDGRRYGYEAHVPKLKDGEQEPYHVRVAQTADLPFIAKTYAEIRKRNLIVCERTPEIFRYELGSQDIENAFAVARVIEDKTGEPVGYLKHLNFIGNGNLSLVFYELKAGASWLDVTPAVVRYLWQTGQEYAKRAGKTCTSFGFALGEQHPAYEAIKDRLPDVRGSYAWYIRVPDLPGFLHHIKPVLEKRLAESIAKGDSREILINFYRTGLRLVIENGQIKTIESWKPNPYPDSGHIAFPNLTFLQMLFGYRSYEEIHYAFPDCWCDDERVRVVLNILFPKKTSNIYPIA